MISTLEVGLKLDALLATLDRRGQDPSLAAPRDLASVVTSEVDDLRAALEQYDIIAEAHLAFVTDEDLTRWMPLRGEE